MKSALTYGERGFFAFLASPSWLSLLGSPFGRAVTEGD